MSLKQLRVIPLFIVMLLFVANGNVMAQNCAVPNFSIDNSYQWPSHRNWVISAFSPIGGDAVVVNSLTLDTTLIKKNGNEVYTNYEGGSATSDDEGNLMFYSNGNRLFKGVGSSAEVIYTGLLSGDEMGATDVRRLNTSASQGMITVRHPLNPNVYHVFTVGDAIAAGAPGMNYFTFDKNGSNLSGPVKYLNKTTEAIAATKHANGIDIWVTVQEYASTNYHVYLITAEGIDIEKSNLNQSVGRNLTGDRSRGGIAFSWDSKKLAETYPSAFPDSDQQINLYDFDNATGTISSRMGIAPMTQLVGGYDIVFAPDNNALYCSGGHGSSMTYIDISSGVKATIQNSVVKLSSNYAGYSVEIGADGNLYTMAYNGSGLLKITGNINSGAVGTPQVVPGTNGKSGRGISTSYLPPADQPKIELAGPICDTASNINLNTFWVCRGTNAEIALSDASPYSGTGIVDKNTGVFSPKVAGVGVHQIVFNAGATADTISIEVVSCGGTVDCSSKNVSVDLGVDQEICSGTSAVLNAGSSDGFVFTWNDGGKGNVDTVTTTGTYWVVKADAFGCADTDSVSITVLDPVVVNLGADKKLCIGDSLELDAGSQFAYNWYGPNVVSSNVQKIWVKESGTYSTIIAGNSKGCTGRDTVDVVFEDCSSNSNCSILNTEPYKWPGHRNWFIGNYSTHKGQIIDMSTLKSTSLAASALYTRSYEGVTTASDDNGNLLFYSNGRSVFTGTGSDVAETYDGLLSGNEGTQSFSSAVQGVITVRHPLNPNHYHVFTTDDAIAGSGRYGFNHYVIDKNGQKVEGPTRLGSFGTSEGVAATFHENGIDIWVAVMAADGNIHSYLLTSDGIDIAHSNLNQAVGFTVSADKLRGALTFSHDGTKFALCQIASFPNMPFGVTVYDFNKATGAFSNKTGIAPSTQVLAPYDIVFSPNDKRIFISRSQGMSLSYIDIATKGYFETGIKTNHSGIEIGPDGKLYIGDSDLKQVNEDLNIATSFTTTIVATDIAKGLPTMYIPPARSVMIVSTDLGTVCNVWKEYNLSAVWGCSQKAAEKHALANDTSNGYFGNGITDRKTGIFNPDGLEEKVHQIVFKMGAVKDTFGIMVEECDRVTSTVNVDFISVQAYPNPTNDVLNISTTAKGRLSCEVITVLGQSVKSVQSDESNFTLNVSDLESGIYFLKISNEAGVVKTVTISKQ